MKTVLLLLTIFLITSCSDTIMQVLEDKPESDIDITSIVIARDMLYPTIENSKKAYGEDQIMVICKNSSETNFYNVTLIGEIEGYSFSDYCQKYINPNSVETLFVSPLLNKEKTKLLEGNVSTPLQVSLKVTEDLDDSSYLFKKSFPITIASKNSALLEVEGSDSKQYYKFLSSWVTPNSTYIDEILKKASTGDVTLIGYSDGGWGGNLNAQIEQIYNTLQAEGITYVNDNFSITGSQNVRFPIDAKNDKMVNCLDGVILYASILESLGFKPLIAITPEHSYVGWKLAEDEFSFLETTATWSEISFSDAFAMGNSKYLMDIERSDFILVDVEKCRNSGILPLLP